MNKLVKVMFLIAALATVLFGSINMSNNTFVDFEDSGEGQVADLPLY